MREFDDRWWNAARKGEEATMREMLKHSRELLSQVVDDNGRRWAWVQGVRGVPVRFMSTCVYCA